MSSGIATRCSAALEADGRRTNAEDTHTHAPAYTHAHEGITKTCRQKPINNDQIGLFHKAPDTEKINKTNKMETKPPISEQAAR